MTRPILAHRSAMDTVARHGRRPIRYEDTSAGQTMAFEVPPPPPGFTGGHRAPTLTGQDSEPWGGGPALLAVCLLAILAVGLWALVSAG